jgi:hypothetical protein
MVEASYVVSSGSEWILRGGHGLGLLGAASLCPPLDRATVEEGMMVSLRWRNLRCARDAGSFGSKPYKQAQSFSYSVQACERYLAGSKLLLRLVGITISTPASVATGEASLDSFTIPTDSSSAKESLVE